MKDFIALLSEITLYQYIQIGFSFSVILLFVSITLLFAAAFGG